MRLIITVMDFIATNILKIAFTIIFIGAIFIKAMYSFEDFPYFTRIDIIDVIAAVIVAITSIVIYRKREWIQEKTNYKVCFTIFMALQIIYIILVPLSPFSDMRAVYDGALNFSQLKWEEFLNDDYWNVFPGNIKLAVFWGIVLIPLPKSLITMKIINAVFIYGIIALIRKLAKEYGVKYYNVVYVILLGFIPLFLYSNHIYFDIPIIMLCLLALYIYKNRNNLVLAFCILGIAKYARTNVSIFFLAIIIIEIFDYFSSKKDNTPLKKELLEILVAVSIFFIISKVATHLVNNKFIEENFQAYSGWNQIYIGLNEEEFGFMDNDFSYDRDAGDVIERVQEYGHIRLAKILGKKTFWLWSQGTYQAQRYAFGIDVQTWEEKFEYETFVTGMLLNDQQILRKVLNSLMRTQYLMLFVFMILFLYTNKDKNTFRLFYYIMIATFLIMLVYELKSRYILQTLPIMAIFAGKSLEMLENSKGFGINEKYNT